MPTTPLPLTLRFVRTLKDHEVPSKGGRGTARRILLFRAEGAPPGLEYLLERFTLGEGRHTYALIARLRPIQPKATLVDGRVDFSAGAPVIEREVADYGWEPPEVDKMSLPAEAEELMTMRSPARIEAALTRILSPLWIETPTTFAVAPLETLAVASAVVAVAPPSDTELTVVFDDARGAGDGVAPIAIVAGDGTLPRFPWAEAASRPKVRAALDALSAAAAVRAGKRLVMSKLLPRLIDRPLPTLPIHASAHGRMEALAACRRAAHGAAPLAGAAERLLAALAGE